MERLVRRFGLGAVLVLVATSAALAGEDAQIVSDDLPATMNPGDRARVTIVVRNTGNEAWHDDKVKLGSVGDANGDACLFRKNAGGDAVRVLFPAGETVPPGGVRELRFDIVAPAAGTYRPEFRMVHEGVQWFGGTAGKTIQVGAAAPTPPPAPTPAPTPTPPPAPPSPPTAPPTTGVAEYGASLVSDNFPGSMRAGDRADVTIVVANAGSKAWTDSEVFLSSFGGASGDAYRFRVGGGGDPLRVPLKSGDTVPRGGVRELKFTIVAPASGTYSPVFQLAVAGKGTFGPSIGRTIQVAAVTPPAPPAPNPLPTPTGGSVVIDDPLNGTTRGMPKGGSLLAEGYRIDANRDYLRYDVPGGAVTEGSFEISVKGLVPGSGGCPDNKGELVTMYDGAFPQAEDTYDGYRNNDFKFFLRKRAGDFCEILWKIGAWYAEVDSPVLPWDPNTTYRFRVEWGSGVLNVYRDGQLIKAVSYPGQWAPREHRIRIGNGGQGIDRSYKGSVSSAFKLVRGKGGSTTPPAPAPIPGKGPHVVRDANYGSRLALRTGGSFFWVSKTAFGLAAQPRWREFIDEAAANGVNVLRVLSGAGKGYSSTFGLPYSMYPFVAGGYDDDHFKRLDQAIAYCGEKGIAVELVLFECGMLGELAQPDVYDATKKQYVDFVVRRYRDLPNIVWEVANEYTHASCGPNPYNGLSSSFVQAVARDVRALDSAHLIGVSGEGGDQVNAAAQDPVIELINYHLPRDGEWWKRPWNAFRANLAAAAGRPQLNDEPIGSHVIDQPGKRSNNAELHRAHAWITAVACGYYTFHCELGLTATPGAQPGQEFLKPFRSFFDGVDMKLMRATTDFVRGSGANETYGCRAGDDELVVYLRGGDLSKPLDLRLLTGVSYTARVVDPSSGTVLATTTINGGDVSVLLPGAGADVAVHLKKK